MHMHMRSRNHIKYLLRFLQHANSTHIFPSFPPPPDIPHLLCEDGDTYFSGAAAASGLLERSGHAAGRLLAELALQ